MKIFAVRSLAAAVITTLGVGFGAVGATAAGATTVVVRPATIVGTYNMGINWGGGYNPDTLTLYKNHTGTDSFDTTTTWSKTGKQITITFVAPGATAIFVGLKTKQGFDTVKKPGTMTNNLGASGTWYAITAP